MYNEKLKIKYIKGYTQSLAMANHATSVFNSFAPYEEEWGADLCTRSTEELQPVADRVFGLYYHSRYIEFSILKGYVRWCQAMKVPGACDGMEHVDIMGIDLMRKQMVSSPLHLQKYLDAICAKESEEMIDNTYRCFFWMAYAGLNEEDALLITKDDIDLETMTIRYMGEELPLYREAIPAFRNAMNLTDFAYKHPGYSKDIRRNRIPGTSIMRGIKANGSLRTLRPELSTRARDAVNSGKTDLRLSYDKVRMSGLFYRMYELERAGERVSFEEETTRVVAGKTYKNPAIQRKQIERDFMNDYQRWKLAFII